VTISPQIPQDPFDQPPEPLPAVDLAPLQRLEAAPAGYGQRGSWYAATLVVVVFGSFCTMLLTGEPLHEALLLAGGVTLLGAEITRRILSDAGPVPSIVVTCAVTALAVVLLVCGYQASDVAVITGMAGIVAGEVVSRVMHPTTPRQGG
jgi:DMSO reductase anchor subunit